MSLTGTLTRTVTLTSSDTKLKGSTENCFNVIEATAEGKLAIAAKKNEFGKCGCVIAARGGCGKDKKYKVTLPKMDDTNNKSSCTVIKGDILENYEYLNYNVQITIKVAASSVVVWTVEYKKKKTTDPEPTDFLQYCADLTGEVDLELSKSK